MSHPPTTRPTFAIACWVMALIAFAQLITIGTALAIRKTPQQATTSPRITPPLIQTKPRSLEEILASTPDIDTTQPTKPDQPTIHVPAPHSSQPTASTPSSLHLSRIADPRVERLAKEARALQIDGDLMRSMLKLDEAQRIDPSEPAVLYQKALLFEQMGIYIKAADHYQKIYEMGIAAGNYYTLASQKLTQGMDSMQARRAVISIGPTALRKKKSPEGVKHVDLSVTILGRPDKPIVPDDVLVQIYFYDQLNGGKITKADKRAITTTTWADSHVDWQDAGNQETLYASYTISDSDLSDTHLFGRREYYGYVIELIYKGEVVDQKAQPGRLNSIHAQNFIPDPADVAPMPWLEDDTNSLLPEKPDNYTLPPLPQP